MTTLPERVAKEVARLATTHPQAKYTKPFGRTECSNVEGNVYENDKKIGVGCIVGQAVLNLGLPIPEESVRVSAVSLMAKLDPRGNNFWGANPTLNYLERVQSEQDQGATWGNAHSTAKTETGYDPLHPKVEA